MRMHTNKTRFPNRWRSTLHLHEEAMNFAIAKMKLHLRGRLSAIQRLVVYHARGNRSMTFASSLVVDGGEKSLFLYLAILGRESWDHIIQAGNDTNGFLVQDEKVAERLMIPRVAAADEAVLSAEGWAIRSGQGCLSR